VNGKTWAWPGHAYRGATHKQSNKQLWTSSGVGQGEANIFGGAEIEMVRIAKNLVILLLELKLL